MKKIKIILLDNIKNLGSIGSQIEVKSGYARNYLFPQSKALLATDYNIEVLKKQKNILQSQIIERKKEAELFAKIINDLDDIVIYSRSSIKGKLFGSVGAKDIADAITKFVDFKISKYQIKLPQNDVLKFVGIYNIKVHIYGDIYANVNIVISSKLDNSKS